MKEKFPKATNFEIETQDPENFQTLMERNLHKVFDVAMGKLMNQPEFYYLETIDDSVLIRKRADNSIVYQTGNPVEIKVLKKIGIERSR